MTYPGDAHLPVAHRSGLRATLVRGVAWTASANIGASVLNAVVGLALTRLLTPADFGIQAAVVTFTSFFGTLADTGLGSAVVQRDDLDQQELSSIFWGGVAISVAIYLLLVAATPAIAQLFGSPALRHAFPVASFSVIIAGVVIVPSALLRRALRFAPLARAQAAGALAGAAVAVVVALSGGHYWALIGYSLTAVTVASVLAWNTSRWTPSMHFDHRQLSRVRGYAGSMMSFLTVNYWARNADDLLIGRFLGVAPLGLYSLGQRLVSAPLQTVMGSIGPLLHPTFAAMGDDLPRQRAAYLDLVRVTALFSFSTAAMLWVLAEPLVHAIAGNAWAPSAGVVRAFAPWVAVQPVNALCGPLFMARDAAHVMLRCAFIGAAAVVAGMLLGLDHGISGVAWGYSLAYILIAAPVSTLVAFRRIDGRIGELARAFAKPLAISTAVLVVELALYVRLDDRVPDTLALLVMMAASAIMLAVIAAPTLGRLGTAMRARKVAP